MSDKIQFRRFQDWTMVYLNGELQRAGDHYLADEWLQARFGVEIVDDEAGVCIPDGRNALKTLAEVAEAGAAHQRRTLAAAEKRKMAADLLAEAEELERA